MSLETQIVLLWIIAPIVLVEMFRLAYLMIITRAISHFPVPFSHHPAYATDSILVVGDSYAVGVGASVPETTFTGLLAKDFPLLDISNFSKNGITTGKLVKHLLNKEEFGRYNLAIVMVGGMDIINHTPLSRLELNLSSLLTILMRHCKKVILVIPGHTGLVPLYHWPFSGILNIRSRKVRRVFKHVAKEFGIDFLEEHSDLLLRDRNRYYAKDKHHPNDEGYRLMYVHLREAMVKVKEPVY